MSSSSTDEEPFKEVPDEIVIPSKEPIIEVPAVIDRLSIKKELDKAVQSFKKSKPLSDIAAILIQHWKLNTMILNFFDYDQGYDVCFSNSKTNTEVHHGRYAYSMALCEYVRDGQIPCEVYENLRNYEFQILYDGHVFCELRINFERDGFQRKHFVILRHTIQTIDKECSIKCQANKTLNFDEEKARLIAYYSPDLCLDPDPVVGDIIIENELNLHPFITPNIKHHIQNEVAKREMGVFVQHRRKKEKREEFENEEREEEILQEAENKVKQLKQDWGFKFPDTNLEKEFKLVPEIGKYKKLLKSYLKERPICFPDQESFTGSHVEIENFVFRYCGLAKGAKRKKITDKFCISVLDYKEYFYGAYKLDERMRDFVPFYWWPIGNRIDLDLCIVAIAHEELKLMCGEVMKITHNRMFHEKYDFSGEKTEIVRQKLDPPVSEEIPPYPQCSDPESDDEVNRCENVDAHEDITQDEVAIDENVEVTEDETDDEVAIDENDEVAIDENVEVSEDEIDAVSIDENVEVYEYETEEDEGGNEAMEE